VTSSGEVQTIETATFKAPDKKAPTEGGTEPPAPGLTDAKPESPAPTNVGEPGDTQKQLDAGAQDLPPPPPPPTSDAKATEPLPSGGLDTSALSGMSGDKKP
jgi:hypothetical protein